MLNGTCTLLQVGRVSTVILHTKMRWEKVSEKFQNAIQVWVRVWVWAQKRSNTVNATGKLCALDSVYTSKQQSNNTQGTVMHIGLFSKKTR